MRILLTFRRVRGSKYANSNRAHEHLLKICTELALAEPVSLRLVSLRDIFSFSWKSNSRAKVPVFLVQLYPKNVFKTKSKM